MFSGLWGKITGKDSQLKYPNQQASSLDRPDDHTIIFPHAMHCDLPDDALLFELVDGVAIPVAVARPSDALRGEPVFFHPKHPDISKIIFRDNGDIEITAPNVRINGNLYVVGETHLDDIVTSVGKDISDSHTHIDTEPGAGTSGVVS